MDILLILARLLHIVLGAFWVGTALFNHFFLGPALLDIGPDAAKVGAALVRRRMMVVMPVAAILTILSGFYLFARVSGSFGAGFMGSRHGQALGVGGVAAVLALILGISVVRPAMVKAGALGQAAAQATGTQRDTLLAQSAALRARSNAGGTWVTGLLAVALVLMAIARYV